MMRDRKLKLKRVVQSRAEAAGLLESAGDAVLIERGRPRWLLMACPCGCREEIPINLDARSGPAWRLYRNRKFGLTVFPSIWRDTGCGSHFIVWRSTIFLFGRGLEEFGSPGREAETLALSKLVRERWPMTGYVPFVDIADLLGEIPWDVLEACRYLVRTGVLIEGLGKQRGMFSRA
jgi:hypothetical protein